MKVLRILREGQPRWARLDGAKAELLDGSIATGFKGTGEIVPVNMNKLLAPVEPSKIVGLAANYPKHAQEMGNPVPEEPRLFLKAPSSLIGPEAPIVLPPRTTRVDPEGELAIVIGKKLYRGKGDECLASVFGYTILNDLTSRDFQQQDRIFGRAKSFDSFCPCGPWIETELDPNDLEIRLVVNREERVKGRTSQMKTPIVEILRFVSDIMTLLPGDVITTGTPDGVAPIAAGDRVEIAIDGIGVLSNPVVNRDDRQG